MKIGLLYNQNKNNAWYEADFDTTETIALLKQSLDELDSQGEVHLMQVTRTNYPDILSQLIEKKFDIVFNVTEGYPGESREAVWPVLMEQFQIQYTGPRPKNLAITLDKSITKKLLSSQLQKYMIQEYFIPTYQTITTNLTESIVERIGFPLFIKLNGEGSSLGINKNSIITDRGSLYSKLLQLREDYPFADILIEEYIEGTDISTTFIEGLGIFGPVEYRYSNHSPIYDYDMKIFDYESVVDVDRYISPIANEVIGLTQEIVQILRLEGYARLEFRVTNDRVKLIEVNNQVCFMSENAFMEAVLMNTRLGYKEVIAHIVKHRLFNPIPYPLI